MKVSGKSANSYFKSDIFVNTIKFKGKHRIIGYLPCKKCKFPIRYNESSRARNTSICDKCYKKVGL
jgi:hypothetical protein